MSESSLLAVSRMMGIFVLSRSLAVARMPSRRGIITSMMIRWMSCSYTSFRASRPS